MIRKCLFSSVAAAGVLAGLTFAVAQSGTGEGAPGVGSATERPASGSGRSPGGGTPGASKPAGGGPGAASGGGAPGRARGEVQAPKATSGAPAGNAAQSPSTGPDSGAASGGRGTRQGGRAAKNTSNPTRAATPPSDGSAPGAGSGGSNSAPAQQPTTLNRGANGERAGARSSEARTSSISTEERSRVSSEIKNVQIKEATNININVSVGGVAPRTITRYWAPVPVEIVRIVPAWRTYRVVKIGNRIFIIQPRTFKVVYIIED
jgi:hypothetical protein